LISEQFRSLGQRASTQIGQSAKNAAGRFPRCMGVHNIKALRNLAIGHDGLETDYSNVRSGQLPARHQRSHSVEVYDVEYNH